MSYTVLQKSKRELAAEGTLASGLAAFLNTVNGTVVSVAYEPESVVVVVHYKSPEPKK